MHFSERINTGFSSCIIAHVYSLLIQSIHVRYDYVCVITIQMIYKKEKSVNFVSSGDTILLPRLCMQSSSPHTVSKDVNPNDARRLVEGHRLYNAASPRPHPLPHVRRQIRTGLNMKGID